MDISEVRAQVARNELLRLIKDIGLPLCLFGTVTEVSAPNASVRLDGDTESTVCSDMVGCSVDDRCIVANIKNMAVVIAAIGGTDTSDKADVDHEHAASDITSGSLSVTHGGTGRTSLTSGQYLVGSGTSAVSLKTKAQVLSDIGAAASSHNHAAGDINSGTLGVARGGTGKGTFTAGSYLVGNGTSGLESKTPAEVLDDIGAAASSHVHAASDVTSGTLAIARIPTITVAKGGTGATDAAGARTNLGITPTNIGAAPTNHTHDYLPLSGGTVTGNIRRKDSVMDKSASSLTSGRYASYIVDDKNGDMIGMFQTVQGLNGNVYVQILSRHSVSGSDIDNYLRLYVTANGTRIVDIPDPAIWLDALGIAETEDQTASLFTAGTGFTTSSLRMSNAGGVGTLTLNVKSTNALTVGTSYTLGTLAAGNRPPSMVYGSVFQGGVVRLASTGVATYVPSSAIAANTTVQMSLTYVIAN